MDHEIGTYGMANRLLYHEGRNVHTKGTEIRIWNEIAVRGKRKEGTCGMTIVYCIMKEGVSILRGQKSVPGINNRERENGKKRTTLSSRELHDKELV
nr:hypothetical protein [Tanacetum cinerariifolium]